MLPWGNGGCSLGHVCLQHSTAAVQAPDPLAGMYVGWCSSRRGADKQAGWVWSAPKQPAGSEQRTWPRHLHSAAAVRPAPIDHLGHLFLGNAGTHCSGRGPAGGGEEEARNRTRPGAMRRHRQHNEGKHAWWPRKESRAGRGGAVLTGNNLLQLLQFLVLPWSAAQAWC